MEDGHRQAARHGQCGRALRSSALWGTSGTTSILHVRFGSLSEVSSVPRAEKPAASPAATWSPGALQWSGRPVLPAAAPTQFSEPCLPSPH